MRAHGYAWTVSTRRLAFASGLLLALVMFATSLLSTQTKHALHTQGALHPWLHVLGFAALAALLLSSTRSDPMRVLCILSLLAFGYSTEAVEGRRNGWGVEVKDVRSDSIGVLSGAVLGLILSPKNKG